MKKYLLLAVLLSGHAGFATTRRVPPKEPRHEFAAPPMRYRMALNTHEVPSDTTAQSELLDGYLECGYGGLTTNANWTDGYLRDEEQMRSMFRFVRKAREKGLDVWLYDENWYPSGMCSSYILDEHPEWECEGLFFRSRTLNGGERMTDTLPAGNPVLVEAFPSEEGRIAFDRGVKICPRGGLLDWTAPKGSAWHVAIVTASTLRKGFQAETDRGGRALPYPSLLLPEVGERFTELTHERYAEVLGAPLSTLFTAAFTDEPSSMALPYYPLGCGVYPWKRNVSEEFARRCGTDLEEALPRIMLDEGPQGDRFRTVYFGIVADFMSGHYFRHLRESCNALGILSGGHLLLEESLMAHTLLYGDIMACYRQMDIPGIDVLTAMPEFTSRYLISARMASSAAELEGRGTVMSEICPVTDPYHRNGAEASTREAVGTINRQLLGGVTKFNNYLQLQHESPEGKRRVNEYVARIAATMQEGVRASEIAVFYPIETMWSRMLPAQTGLSSWDRVSGGAAGAQHLDSLFERTSMELFASHREFSYVDSKALAESSVRKGTLRHGKLSWRAVLLAGVETIPEEALARTVEFAEAGGAVIVLETLPENSPTQFPSEAIRALTERLTRAPRYLFLTSPEELERLPEILPQAPLRISDQEGILTAHRKTESDDLFFIVNDTDRPRTLSVYVPNAVSGQVLDPATGETSVCSADRTELHLEAFRGKLLRVKIR